MKRTHYKVAKTELALCGTESSQLTSSALKTDCKRCQHFMKGPTVVMSAQQKFIQEKAEKAVLRNEIVSPNDFKIIDKNHCLNCDNFVHVQIFKGSGYCSDDCRKALTGER